MGTLHEDRYTFFIISCSFLRIRNVSDKRCRGNQNSHFVFSNFFSFENRAIYEIMWKNIVERSRPQVTMWHMHIACCLPKATDTKSCCVILIAFPLQLWLHICALMLCYMYIGCLVFNSHHTFIIEFGWFLLLQLSHLNFLIIISRCKLSKYRAYNWYF